MADKSHRDEAWKQIMNDERMKPEGEMPFSGPRMIWAGFEPILDTACEPSTQTELGRGPG